MSLGIDTPFTIETPLMWIDKAGTWALAVETRRRELWSTSSSSDTHTCYLGDRTHRHPWGYGCGTVPGVRTESQGLEGMAGADDLKRAVDLALAGDWDGAHAIAQGDESDVLFCWLHACLHKIEGDTGNSRYWYRRAGAALRGLFGYATTSLWQLVPPGKGELTVIGPKGRGAYPSRLSNRTPCKGGFNP